MGIGLGPDMLRQSLGGGGAGSGGSSSSSTRASEGSGMGMYGYNTERMHICYEGASAAGKGDVQ